LIKIIETPRDAFQGIPNFIPTETKVRIINLLLQAGFDTVEVGSFVSKEVIPQMADAAEVLSGLNLANTKSRIMVLVGNKHGGLEAVRSSQFAVRNSRIQNSNLKNQTLDGPGTGNCELGTANSGIDDILYPFSVSPSFLKRNLNTDIDRAKGTILDLMEICELHKKRLIVYLTMAFGNPYGDKWDPGLVEEWAGYLYELGLRVIPLSDILGEVSTGVITKVYTRVIKTFPDIEFGIHLHSKPGEEHDKIDAAWKAGVRRFDSVTGGFGGCPMADDHLVSNLDTFALIDYCEKNGVEHGLNVELLGKVREDMRVLSSEF
jgi:hydroxymethylglutaryl-CoA lyase